MSAFRYQRLAIKSCVGHEGFSPSTCKSRIVFCLKSDAFAGIKIPVAGNCNRPTHESRGPLRWLNVRKAASPQALSYRPTTCTRAAEQSDGLQAEPCRRGSPSTRANGTGKGAAL